MKKLILTLCTLVVSFTVVADPLYMTKSSKTDYVIDKEFYKLQYNEDTETAEWVGYELTIEMLDHKFPRDKYFYREITNNNSSMKTRDYTNTGYDRGHLVPAYDMGFSKESMHSSFSMFNITPQAPNLNRGRWKSLEELVRDWVEVYGTLYVVTGTDYSQGIIETLGGEIQVPKYFYKAIFRFDNGGVTAIGFILPNEKCELDLEDYVVSIDEIEDRTGLDLFYLVGDRAEEAMESEVYIEDWYFK